MWWGAWTFEQGELRRWRIGPGEVWAHRSGHEWRLASEAGADPFDTSLEVAVPESFDDLDALPGSARFVGEQLDDSLRLVPAGADRPIVARPATPVTVLPRKRIALYVSSPLWLRVYSGAELLQDLPLYRPSDTWFGPSSRDGELCYATRSRCRLEVADLPVQPHRAVTAVQVHNRGAAPLCIERIAVPLPVLSVFAGEQGHLWTEAITLTREDEDGRAELRVGDAPPVEAKARERVGERRRKPESRGLVRAFAGLF